MRILIIVMFIVTCCQAWGQSELKEISTSNLSKYISDGHNSHGLKFMFRYPKSFQPMEGLRMDEVKRFGRNNSPLSIAISVYDSSRVSHSPTTQRTTMERELKSEPQNRKVNIIKSDTIMINDLRWSYFDLPTTNKAKVSKTTFTYYNQIRSYTILNQDYVVTIMFKITSDQSARDAENLFEQYKDSFLSEMKTFAILSDWGK